MKELLLTEYNRLVELEKYRLESQDRVIQMYIGVISAGAGILIVLWDDQIARASLQLNFALIFSVILLIGEITYLRILGIDFDMARIAKAMQLIREQLVPKESKDIRIFPKGLANDERKYKTFSSIKGILNRVITISGPKTTIVVLNCIVASGLGIFIFWPSTYFHGFLIGICLVIFTGGIHVLHAHWRYKIADSEVIEAAGWWI